MEHKVIFVDHVQGSLTMAQWLCSCGEKWVSNKVLPCPWDKVAQRSLQERSKNEPSWVKAWGGNEEDQAWGYLQNKPWNKKR